MYMSNYYMLKSHFLHYDFKKDWRLSINEVMAAFAALGVRSAGQRARLVLEEVDVNSGGRTSTSTPDEMNVLIGYTINLLKSTL
ncbi:hypothetical protein SLA2020_361210 [Shorea laevis]